MGSFYGYATGIVGLRLFPNPDFDEAAAKKWDPKRFYDDPTYYNDKKLVRPYRVGMSCGFCHVGPNPVKPPADPENPKWENLSSNVGAQYFWVDRIFTWEADPSSFAFQLFHTSRPGTLDTSLVSTDNINNPRTMNAVYGLPWRLSVAMRWGKETLAGGELNNKQFNDFVHEGPLTQFFQPPNTVYTGKILKDGSDSVGALGALNRVYLNIGLFSEEWLLHFRPLVGGKPITPIEIAVANKNSTYWNVTQEQTFQMAQFFLKSTAPHLLKDAPGGDAYLTKDKAKLDRGKVVFAERCARCHSSKIPQPAPGVDPGGCSGKDYLDCWNKYWAWTKTEEFKSQMRRMVKQPDFLDRELSVDRSARASDSVADERMQSAGHQFNRRQHLGQLLLAHLQGTSIRRFGYLVPPIHGRRRAPIRCPAGGRGYTRPASLISVWSTAPFLQNNAVGKFDPSPSVEARMRSFQDSIEKMLWPEKREKDKLLGDKVPGTIDRTTATSYLRVPGGYLPDFLKPLLGPGERYFPSIFGEGGVQIGPIPAGTPVDLLANLDILGEATEPAEKLRRQEKVLNLLLKMKHDLNGLPKGATDEDAKKAFSNLVEPLLELSKCPDFVVNRGHYFGTSMFAEEPGLSDDDKRSLIEYIKTF